MALKRLRFLEDITDDDDFVGLFDSGDEQDVKHGGSKPGKKPNLNRDFKMGHANILRDYFGENPIYPEEYFRRRFRMSSKLFNKIFNDVVAATPDLKQRFDATKKPGPSPLQKVTAAIRMLAYGIAGDAVDEYCRLSESLAHECLHAFVNGVISVFGKVYLRAPTPADINRIQKYNEQLGWPGQAFSIDVMHWQWKNCPKAYAGQYSGKEQGLPTMALEAIVGPDGHIWWATFGYPGSLNDLNILDRSPLITDILENRFKCEPYSINGETFDEYYLLTDGIYPRWSNFVRSFKQPDTLRKKHFAKAQEAKRKEVERVFGMLEGRFNILSIPGRSWKTSTMKAIVKACVILHNMIIDDQRDETSLD